MGMRPSPVLTLRASECPMLGGGAPPAAVIDVFDAMRAASPPRSAELEGCGADLYGEEAMAAQYRAWKTKHPSALESFENFARAAEGKQVAVFLDYDGTLSPIVADPDTAVMTEGMRAAVKNVAALFPTAIISGRGREKVYDFVQLAELYYAGSHGLDIMGPPPRVAPAPLPQLLRSSSDRKTVTAGALSAAAAAAAQSSTRKNTCSGGFDTGKEAVCCPNTQEEEEEEKEEREEDERKRHHHHEQKHKDLNQDERVYLQPAKAFIPIIDEVSTKIRERAASIPGTSVENNKFCVSVHFRRVDEHRWERLAKIVKEVVKDYPGLRLSHGRKVLEIRPELEWDKGKAVAYLLDALGLDNVVPLYIGDDRTDEDAFDVLNERGNGYGILVSSVAKSTRAVFSLQDTSEVMEFLRRLVDWKQDKNGTKTKATMMMRSSAMHQSAL